MDQLIEATEIDNADFEAQYAAVEAACAAAAELHGVADMHARCEYGELGCPTCPARVKGV